MAKEVHKLQQLSDGDSNPHIIELKAHHNELVKAHNQLVDSCNANWRNFSSTVQHLDVRVGAVYTAFQDLVDSLESVGQGYSAKVLKSSIALEPGAVPVVRVDWPKYLQQHIDTLQVELARLEAARAETGVDGISSLEELQSAMEVDPLVTPEVPEEADEDPATVFGGDHAQAQPEVEARST